MAKKDPDSRTPRRFIVISTTTINAATRPSLPCRKGNIAFAFCTPEDTDTATVRT